MNRFGGRAVAVLGAIAMGCGGALASLTVAGAAESVTVSVGSAGVFEGNTGARQMVFSVTLSDPAAGPVTVDYSLAGGSATGAAKKAKGVDFNDLGGAPQALTFAPGDVVKQVEVTVYPDKVVEGDETLSLTLSNATGATIDPFNPVGHGTIVDDDNPVSSSVQVAGGSASIVEGDSGTRAIVFPITLSRPATSLVSVDFTVAGVGLTPTTVGTSGTTGVDVSDNGGTHTVTFTPNPHSGKTPVVAFVAVDTFPDNTPEPNEQFALQLSNPQGATIASDASGTVREDDFLAWTTPPAMHPGVAAHFASIDPCPTVRGDGSPLQGKRIAGVLVEFQGGGGSGFGPLKVKKSGKWAADLTLNGEGFPPQGTAFGDCEDFIGFTGVPIALYEPHPVTIG